MDKVDKYLKSNKTINEGIFSSLIDDIKRVASTKVTGKEHIRRICVDLGPEGKDIDFGDGMPFFKPEEGPPVEPPVDPPAEQPKSNWTLFRWLSGIFQKIWPW